jgi:hypothetical protein
MPTELPVVCQTLTSEDNIMTIDDVKTMIGKTYTRNGNMRTICRIDDLYQGVCGFTGNVYWKRPGGKERRLPQYLPYFLDWVKNASEVPQEEDEAIKLVRDLVEEFDVAEFDNDEYESYILGPKTRDAIRTLLARATG